jgi:hypothetical protein
MTNETPTALEDFHEMLAIYAKAIEEHFAIQAANAIHPCAADCAAHRRS